MKQKTIQEKYCKKHEYKYKMSIILIVIIIYLFLLTVHVNSDEQEDDDVKAIAPSSETAKPRRSLRRLSVDQNTGSMTPRRSARRASMEANMKIEQWTKPTRRASCSSVFENRSDAANVATPKRKRRLTEESSTPTRRSERLCNTPKRTFQVDDAVGDMGVIVEEDAGSEQAEGR